MFSAIKHEQYNRESDRTSSFADSTVMLVANHRQCCHTLHALPSQECDTYICNWQRFSIRSSQRHQRRHNKSAGQLACWPAINQATCFEGHSSVLPGPFGSTILTYVRTPPSFSVRVLITIALTKHITKSDNTTRLRYLAMWCQTN